MEGHTGRNQADQQTHAGIDVGTSQCSTQPNKLAIASKTSMTLNQMTIGPSSHLMDSASHRSAANWNDLYSGRQLLSGETGH